MIDIARVNTILYSAQWAAMVAFYRDALGLHVEFRNDWFVEFAVGPAAYVSVADAAHASIPPGDGTGVTLSWQVADVAVVRELLRGAGVEVGDVGTRWGSRVLDVRDPDGNRIEFWSGTPTGETASI